MHFEVVEISLIMRNILVWLHRYVGLLIAIFLLVAASTGAILTFYHELDELMIDAHIGHKTNNPYRAIDPLKVRQKIAEKYTDYGVNYVRLTPTNDQFEIYYLTASKNIQAESSKELIVDRYSGEVLLERKWGDIREGWINLFPFIYRLHYSLALDDVGEWLLGISALLWTLDCFIGAYLTMPAHRRNQRQGWLSRWRHAWVIRRFSSTYKINFDLHRSFGLWFWAMLFVLAWSSVALNLKSVYQPVMDFAFDRQTNPIAELKEVENFDHKPMEWRAALEVGRQRMQESANQQGFKVLNEQAIVYHPKKIAFEYRVKSDRDIWDDIGLTRVYFNAVNGKLLGTYIPTGEAAGDTITTWLLALHLAQTWGVPYKIFLFLIGVAVLVLTVTGLYIWWRKRAAKLIYMARLRH